MGLVKKLNVPLVEKLPVMFWLPVKMLFPPRSANAPELSPFSVAALTLVSSDPFPLKLPALIVPPAANPPFTVSLPATLTVVPL